MRMRTATKKTSTRQERDARRLKINDARVAMLLPDVPLDDDEQMFVRMARRLTMLLGNTRRSWRGCKEPACRRARACIAPRSDCSNAPPSRPDPDGRRLARTQAWFDRMRRERLAMLEEKEGH